MSTQKNLITLCAAAVFTLGLAACGGGSSTPPDYTLSDAQMGATVPAGTHTISGDLADAFPADAAMYLGQNFATGAIVENVGGLDFACVAGPCSVTVAPDGSHITTTGTIEVVMMGGDFPTAMRTPPVDPAVAQRADIAAKITAAQTAVNAVDDDSTDAEVSAADAAITAAKMAIAAAANVPAEEKAANTGTVNALETQLSGAKTARMEAMNEADKEARATAAKLYDGISAATDETDATTRRHAAYSGTNDSQITVSIGDSSTGTTHTLSEDKDTTVAANHGWTGKRFADPAGGPMVEAMVYSNVGAPTQGRKFGNAEPGTGDNRSFEYTLVGGVLTEANAGGVGGTATDFIPARVAFTGVTRTAGTETFRLPSPNVGSQTAIVIPGSYHGVSGTYSCTPADAAVGCSAAVAARGFTVSAGDTWAFTPGNANSRVTDAPDTAYASYGWWIHKSADGAKFTASVFVDEKGTASTAPDIADLVAGTATYRGGAAGKYALSSSTGGMNDSGHFTARATLEADFSDDMITGTIDNFMGADGMARNWSVELMKQGVGANGTILGDDGTGTAKMTKWTIDGTAATAGGEWSGNLREEGTDGVPKVATGTFYSTYGRVGKMVGAFGANKQ